MDHLSIAMLSIHSSPLGPLGAKKTGGMSVVIRETAQAMGALGHRVDIYTAVPDGCRDPVTALSENVRLIRLDNGSGEKISQSALYQQLPGYYNAFEDFTETEGVTYDLLHSHYWISGLLGQRLHAKWSIPHIVTFHTLGWLKNRFGPVSTETDLRIESERRLAQSCNMMLVSTLAERASLIEHYGVDDYRVAVVPFGVNKTTFDIRDVQEARERTGLDADESVILFVGRFVPLKGIERLMEAVALLTLDEKVRLFLIGGDGPDSGVTLNLKVLSQRMGIGNQVNFPGRVDQAELVDFYNAVDVVVVPSYYESFGLVVLESLACGTPVVATPVGIVESVVCDRENGLVVRGKSAADLAKSLAQALAWVRVGRIRPGVVRASVLNFDWSIVAQKVMKQYFRVIDAEASTLMPIADELTQ